MPTAHMGEGFIHLADACSMALTEILHKACRCRDDYTLMSCHGVATQSAGGTVEPGYSYTLPPPSGVAISTVKSNLVRILNTEG